MPSTPPPTLADRRPTRQLHVGPVGVGSQYPVSVQSMTTTLTADVNSTLQQIAELTASGCDIVRVACPSQDDAEALPAIAKKSQIPVIADIHFQPRYVFAAIEAGCAAVRVNPGNIRKFDDQVKQIAREAKDHGTPIRIGVNAGSLDKRLMDKYGKATPEALVESALWEASLFAEHDFHDIKISVKHHDPVIMVRAYELLSEACDYPLHLGVTEAGPAFQGTIKSATAFGALLSQGIGDTIRVSLSAPPVEEVKVGNQILESLNLRPRRLEIVSCPSCGRAQVDVYKLAEEVTAGLTGMEVPLRVAVMGCVVNGPGEAREADLGVASGNGKGQIFVRGEVIRTVPEAQIVETLIDEAMRLAEGMQEQGVPEVTVT
jgi:(E)-4-hydroxy-3-methylbut-2-enyl-diphosphate synthase